MRVHAVQTFIHFPTAVTVFKNCNMFTVYVLFLLFEVVSCVLSEQLLVHYVPC